VGKPTANIGTVPAAAEKSGDFSSLLGLGLAVPDLTIRRVPSPRPMGGSHGSPCLATSFPPATLTRWPRPFNPFMPRRIRWARQPGQNNYTRNTKDTFDYNVYVARVDHSFSDKNRAFVRLSYDKYLETDSSFNNNISGGLDLTRINRGGWWTM